MFSLLFYNRNSKTNYIKFSINTTPLSEKERNKEKKNQIKRKLNATKNLKEKKIIIQRKLSKIDCAFMKSSHVSLYCPL